MKSLNEIISKNQNNTEFPFLGNTLIIPTKRRVYSQVRKKYDYLALLAGKKYADKIKIYVNADILINNFLNDLLYSFDDIIKELVKDLVSVDCYTIDEEAIGKICAEKGYLAPALNALAEYKRIYEAIHLKRNMKIANYNQNRNVGIQSAENVAFKQALLNNSSYNNYAATTGITTAIAYAMTSSANNKANEQFQQEINVFFKNPVHRQNIIYSVIASAQNLGKIIIENTDCNDAITSDASTKARALYNNFSIIPEEKAKEISLNILQLDPYQSEYYIAFVKKYIKNSKEIIAIADYLGVDLTDGLSEIVKKVAISNIGTTLDDVKSCRKLLNDVIAELGFPEKCKQEAEQFIQERCVAIFKDYISKNIGTNEEAAKKLRIETEEFVKEYSLSQNNALVLYKQIDDKLNKYDIEYRTIMGVVFTSREYAEANRKAIEQNKDILYKTRNDFIFRRDIVENIEKIKRIQMHPNLIEKFVNGYNRLLTDFDNKCQNAKCYEDKLRGNNSMKGFMKSMTTNVESMKRDWLELTRNGQYSIYDIMGIQR